MKKRKRATNKTQVTDVLRAAGMVKDWGRDTNINTLVVPPHMLVRVATGLPHFDLALGGEGMIPSQVILFTAPPGLGKTTTALQLADALTGAGHVCLYNANEENLYQVRQTTTRLRLQHGFIAGQHSRLDELLEHSLFLMKKYPTKRVVIIQDSLQALDDGFYKDGGKNSMTAVRCAIGLINFAKDIAALSRELGIPEDQVIPPVVIFIGQATKNGDFAGKNAIAHAVDTKLRIRIDKDKESTYYGARLLYAEKNRMGMAGIDVPLMMTRTGLTAHPDFKLEDVFDADGNLADKRVSEDSEDEEEGEDVDAESAAA